MLPPEYVHGPPIKEYEYIPLELPGRSSMYCHCERLLKGLILWKPLQEYVPVDKKPPSEIALSEKKKSSIYIPIEKKLSEYIPTKKESSIYIKIRKVYKLFLDSISTSIWKT